MVRYKPGEADSRGWIKTMFLDAKRVPGSSDITIRVTPVIAELQPRPPEQKE